MQWLRTHRWVLIMVLVTLVLRLPLLTGSFWLDEAAQILESSRSFSEQLNIRDDFQPPLLHLLTFLTHLFSTAEWWLRLWGAVIPSLLVTWIMFQLPQEWWPAKDKNLFKKQLWLGALLATNSLWVFFSQELRPYSLAVLWTCLSWWYIVKLLHSSKVNQNYWAGWVLSVVLGLYSTYLFPFVLVSQGLYLGWQAIQKPKLWQPFLLACLAVGIGFAPWVPSFLGQLNAGQQLRVDLPGWDQVVSTTQLKALPLAFGKFLFGVVDLELNWQYAVPTLAVVTLAGWLKLKAWHHFKQLSQETKSALLIFSWWVMVPLVLAWLVSFKIPVIQPKRILFVLPALYGFMVVLATELRQKIQLNVGSVLLTLLLGINIWGLTQYWTQPQYQRENWRLVHRQLLSRYPSEESVAVFSFGGPFAGWQWYDKNQTPSLSLGYLSKPKAVDVTDKLKHLNETANYVFVFEYLETLTDPRLELKQGLQSLGWKEIDAVSAPGVGFVRVYAKPQNLLGLNDQDFINY